MRTDNAKHAQCRYGRVLGLNGDQVAYAAQASNGTLRVTSEEVVAELTGENYHHTQDDLFILFTKENMQRLRTALRGVQDAAFESDGSVLVEFNIKASYFLNLKKALHEIPSEMIVKLLPNQGDFREFTHQLPKRFYDRLKLGRCSEDQLQALQTIVSCPPNGPPVLVSGAFGTGKTYLLAMAAHYFLQEARDTRGSALVLVCTQQHVSADAYLECFCALMEHGDAQVVRLVTDRKFSKQNTHHLTVHMFQRHLQKHSYQVGNKFVVITTFQTALRLVEFLSPGFFTHVLLDEGAQAREPETIAPLCLASHSSKVVIAGDQHQVRVCTLTPQVIYCMAINNAIGGEEGGGRGRGGGGCN